MLKEFKMSQRNEDNKIQPCRECSDECGEEVTNNIIGRWSINCDNPIGITIKDNNELIMTIEPNQYYVHLIKIEDKTEKNNIKYKLKQFEGVGAKEVYSEAYLNDKEVAVIKFLGGDEIEFNWLGFYNKVNKQRQYTESLISNENPIVLKKCDD
ncbi:hypothetical protein [Chryseobacterium sp.]|jgi:hypothetical protein|uniref:hypothetical protein n=1 Tax=Chryseobacterium sp. TaxID=1871047 RepID=UPI002851E7E5|nr:hypothetical protein [Chryseobacterium sp.]MDR3025166.1 hypothetical protein [Chryseobacterium sp.]